MLSVDPDVVAQPVTVGEEKGLPRDSSNEQLISTNEMCEIEEFTCRNCGGGDRGRVAIYRPFGEVSLSLNRTVTCMVLKANDRRTSCPCHDEFRGPRSDYVRQSIILSLSPSAWSKHPPSLPPSLPPFEGSASACLAKLGTYRRSLPNLNREQLALRQSKNKGSTSQIQGQVRGVAVGRKSDSQVQKTRREAKSPLRVKQYNQMSLHQTTFQSPENSEPVPILPRSADSVDVRVRARSGLPRPSRASSASRNAARSGIPMPSALGKKRVEDSWSEGCF
ncbi:uncharacterized protein TNCV_2818941 [Trichonephila clavipes]|nr:uncharacterized protein TNCV_2818941 [Trichonephila clavipes]